MSKYVVKREEVCAGNLLKTDGLSFKILNSDKSNDEIQEKGLKFSFYNGLICRPMLFKVNEEGLADDLIYTTPTNYPINGIKNNIENSNFIINDYVKLDELLKYLNYKEYLTQSDLLKIYRKLLTHEWWLEHHLELFGWKKSKLSSYCYVNDGKQVLPMEIYDNLRQISESGKSKPHNKEPHYELIKKRK